MCAVLDVTINPWHCYQFWVIMLPPCIQLGINHTNKFGWLDHYDIWCIWCAWLKQDVVNYLEPHVRAFQPSCRSTEASHSQPLEPLIGKHEGNFNPVTQESTLSSLRKMGFGTEPSKGSVSLHSTCTCYWVRLRRYKRNLVIILPVVTLSCLARPTRMITVKRSSQ